MVKNKYDAKIGYAPDVDCLAIGLADPREVMGPCDSVEVIELSDREIITMYLNKAGRILKIDVENTKIDKLISEGIFPTDLSRIPYSYDSEKDRLSWNFEEGEPVETIKRKSWDTEYEGAEFESIFTGMNFFLKPPLPHKVSKHYIA